MLSIVFAVALLVGFHVTRRGVRTLLSHLGSGSVFLMSICKGIAEEKWTGVLDGPGVERVLLVISHLESPRDASPLSRRRQSVQAHDSVVRSSRADRIRNSISSNVA